jgi:septum formation protein
MQIILGSTSPRRQEILNYFSLPYRIEAPDIDEEAIGFEGDPEKYVLAIAKAKGDVLAAKFKEDLIIAADTTVHLQGQVFNKPKNGTEAFAALTLLAGKSHEVYTGVSLTCGNKQELMADKTIVYFKPLTANEIKMYQQAVHSYDKAGGYTIQGVGSLIIERIEGEYTNVMGLPLSVVSILLKKFDVDLWNYL